jgi:hypothetical protein
MTSSKPSIQGIYSEVRELTGFLLQEGFADDQNYPIRKGDARNADISFPDAEYARMLRNIPYERLYREQRENRSYNVLMLDGAMIQISYRFPLCQTRVRQDEPVNISAQGETGINQT